MKKTKRLFGGQQKGRQVFGRQRAVVLNSAPIFRVKNQNRKLAENSRRRTRLFFLPSAKLFVTPSMGMPAIDGGKINLVIKDMRNLFQSVFRSHRISVPRGVKHDKRVQISAVRFFKSRKNVSREKMWGIRAILCLLRLFLLAPICW